VKIYRRSYFASVTNRDSLLREVDILQNLSSSKKKSSLHVITLLDFFHFDGEVFLIFDLKPQDLLEFLLSPESPSKQRKVLSEADIRRIFLQLLTTVRVLHKQGIVHGDIKLENIMVDPESLEVWLIDFGLAEYYFDKSSERAKVAQHPPKEEAKKRRKRRISGTVGYMAPEVILWELTGNVNPAMRDIYSLGVLLYALSFQHLPFNDIDGRAYYSPEDLTSRTSRQDLKFSRRSSSKDEAVEEKTVSEELKDLIRRMLCTNPTMRISIHEILTHTWVRNNLTEIDELKTQLPIENEFQL